MTRPGIVDGMQDLDTQDGQPVPVRTNIHLRGSCVTQKWAS
jgi:hypothetical protein